MTRFEELLNQAHQACGKEGFVTFEELAKVFTTPKWEGLSKPDSRIYKVLNSEVFCENNDGHINYETLLCMGILHCVEKKKGTKAIALFNLLQEGGVEANEFITAGDKDIEPNFKKFCLLSTVHIFNWMEQFADFDCPLKDDYEKITEAIPDFREDVWLDAIYGTNSKLGS